MTLTIMITPSIHANSSSPTCVQAPINPPDQAKSHPIFAFYLQEHVIHFSVPMPEIGYIHANHQSPSPTQNVPTQ